ncbi:MAG: glutamine synthetase type III, partial [Bacteroidetes Order II. Incertae sedis bacterium]|nr:glutamine synthetase type III [Bacteroidetes Order II. bacterium]
KTTVDALETLVSEKNIKLFETYGVLSEAELRSREDIWVEQYFLSINIEAETTEHMARTMVMPAATRYLDSLVDTIQKGKKAGVSTKGVKLVADHAAAYVDELQVALGELIDQNKELGGDSVHEKAHHMLDNVIPAMMKVRHATDRLERITAGDLWPLPTYRDILFVK